MTDSEGERCQPSGGFEVNPDPLQKRGGKAPNKEMKEMLTKTIEEVKVKISEKNVKANKTMSWNDIKDCLDILKGAVTIVYPMGLPDYEPIRMEIENREEIDPNSYHGRKVIDPTEATIWFANKEMKRENKLSAHVGKNEKTKVIVKLSTKRRGQPASETGLSPETQKKLMAENYKRMEELKRLEKEAAEDDSCLDSDWADSQNLKRKMQGLNNISWRP